MNTLKEIKKELRSYRIYVDIAWGDVKDGAMTHEEYQKTNKELLEAHAKAILKLALECVGEDLPENHTENGHYRDTVYATNKTKQLIRNNLVGKQMKKGKSDE